MEKAAILSRPQYVKLQQRSSDEQKSNFPKETCIDRIEYKTQYEQYLLLLTMRLQTQFNLTWWSFCIWNGISNKSKQCEKKWIQICRLQNDDHLALASMCSRLATRAEIVDLYQEVCFIFKWSTYSYTKVHRHRSPMNSPQRPVTRSFEVFFDLRLNKRLSKQS